MDREHRGTKVFMEFGLVTPAELEQLTAVQGCRPSAPATQMTTQVGTTQHMHVILLNGLDCGTIHSMRRVQVYTDTFISQEEMLLEAARQLHEQQPQNVFDHNYARLLKTSPVGLKEANGQRHLQTVADITANSTGNLGLSTIDLTNMPVSNVSRRAAAVLPNKKRKAAKPSGAEAVPEGQCIPLSAAPSRKRGKGPDVVDGAETCSQTSRVSATGAMPAGAETLPPELKKVSQAMGQVPQCFRNISIEKLLLGEKLGNQLKGVGSSVVGQAFISLKP